MKSGTTPQEVARIKYFVPEPRGKYYDKCRVTGCNNRMSHNALEYCDDHFEIWRSSRNVVPKREDLIFFNRRKERKS